jgi:pyruvate dehydrogenase E1 component alpha subunit
MSSKENPLTALEEKVIRIRLSQILINEYYKAGKFKIPVHLEMGHEALIVAVGSVLTSEDKLITTHRNSGYNLGQLGKLRPILDEYLLESTGLQQGRLGSMNLINPPRNIIYSSSILGNGFPVASGIAMADKLAKRPAVTFVLGGDGSIEEGSFYESLAMMQTLGCPNVVLIENNEWSLATKISERRCPIDISKICEGISVPYFLLSGNEVADYSQKLASIRKQVLETSSPICVEVVLRTLGDYRGAPSEEHPDGKYINYHAGPSPVVDLTKCDNAGVLNESNEDPVHVIGLRCGMEEVKRVSAKILAELQEEIR